MRMNKKEKEIYNKGVFDGNLQIRIGELKTVRENFEKMKVEFERMKNKRYTEKQDEVLSALVKVAESICYTVRSFDRNL